MLGAERKYIIDASPERVWELIGEAMFSALKLEGVRVTDAFNFSALLRLRIGFFKMPLSIMGRFIETSPSRFLAATVEVKGMRGVIWLNMRLNIAFTSVDKDKTEVATEMIAAGMGILVRIFLSWKVKSFINEMLDGIERELKQLG